MKKLFLFLLVILALTNTSFASYISLNTTVTAKSDKTNLKILVSAQNKGDESAFNVKAGIKAGNKTILAASKQELGINQIYSAEALVGFENQISGQYPLVVTMHYADANQYPFSALNAQTFNVKVDTLPSDLFGQMGATTIWQDGELALKLKNLGDSNINASIYLATPRELTSTASPQAISIPAKEQTSITFPVKNFSALNGSAYQVFAVAEYDLNGSHHTTITPGTVRISESKKIFGVDYNALLIIAIILIGAFLVFQFLPKNNKK